MAEATHLQYELHEAEHGDGVNDAEEGQLNNVDEEPEELVREEGIDGIHHKLDIIGSKKDAGIEEDSTTSRAIGISN